MSPSGTGARPPTIADVARAASVSPTTVSHALNGIGKVDPRTRERIKAIAAELGYRPNLRAQRLRRGRPRPSPWRRRCRSPWRADRHGSASTWRSPPPRRNARSCTATHSCSSRRSVRGPPCTRWTSTGPSSWSRTPTTSRWRSCASGAALRGARTAGLPADAAPYVDLRGAPVAELLLGHLREQGAVRPALIVGDGARHSGVDARTVYERAAARHGWDPMVAAAPEEGVNRPGTTPARRCSPPTPASTPSAPWWTPSPSERSGRSWTAAAWIPQDVAVVTRYDGLRARTCEPPLTAVDLHLDHAASEAVELLLGRLRGQDTPPVATAPEPRLIARASSLRGGPAS